MIRISNKEKCAINIIIKIIKSKKELYKSFDMSNVHQKHSLFDYLSNILYVLRTGISWRDIPSDICWNSVYKAFIKINKYKIFEYSYCSLLKKYSNKNKRSFKYLLTDTSFIPNKKGKDVIGYNKYYNRKNGTKISMITNEKGIPINIKCYAGNRNDGKILVEQLETNDNLVNVHHLKKHKRFFLADPGYDTKEVRQKLKSKNYNTIIQQNKRNIKDETKIIQLTKTEKKIYMKRLAVENMFSKIKANKRLSLRYDSKITSYMGFLFMALIKILC